MLLAGFQKNVFVQHASLDFGDWKLVGAFIECVADDEVFLFQHIFIWGTFPN